MGTLVDCMNFQEDLKGLLFDGSTLKDEDSCLFDFISNLENPRGVLDNIKNFKDEGNSSFKDGDFNGALEKYSLACVFLSCLVLQEEDARYSFSKLATITVLNMAASLLKKNEFRQVGHLCTIILKYNPGNVKALFRRASAAMGLGKNELASWDLKLAYEVEPSNLEVVKKLREVETLLHQPPHELGQGKEKRLKHSRGMSISDIEENKEVSSQDQESPNYIEIGECTSMEVESNNGRAFAKEFNHEGGDYKSKEVKMNERDEGIKENDKVSKSNQELRKHNYHFHNRKKPRFALAISKRDYLLLAQGRTLQHYNPNSGVVMSIRVKGSAPETSKQVSESPPYQKPHLSPMENVEHIPLEDIITHNMDLVDAQRLSMEIPPSEPEDISNDQVVGDIPTIQDCSSYVTPFDSSHLRFQTITTGNRSPYRKAKNRLPTKGVKKERKNLHKKPSCVLSNNVFQCRYKVEARIKHNEDHIPSGHNLPGCRSGMKRKSIFLQSPELPQQRKFIIIHNKVCNSCSHSVFNLSMQVDKFSDCMNCVRI